MCESPREDEGRTLRPAYGLPHPESRISNPGICCLVHIPDGFLSAGVVTATWVAAGVTIAAALRAEKADPNPMPAGILGSTAAFLFAAQMVNVPVAPGTSGHLVGAALGVALLGPWRALVAMFVVLLIQALLFQDGGFGSLGANIIDMGVAGIGTAYAVLVLTAKWQSGPRGVAIGSMLGAFVATLAAAVLTGVWLAWSGLYPLRAIVQILLLTHVPIGVLEAALTGAVVVTVLKWRPDLVAGVSADRRIAHPGPALAGLLGVALAIAAFLAPFASSLPDGLERTAEALGFAGRAQPQWTAPFPDYVIPYLGSSGAAAGVAGLLGTLAVATIAWGISRTLRTPPDAVHR